MNNISTKRITVVLEEETTRKLEELKKEFNENQSELIRESLNFFHKNREFIEKHGVEKIKFYTEMLSKNEHIILDVDHWTLFLKKLNEVPKDDFFWKKLPNVAKSHAEELKDKIESPQDYLKRIETCNFFNLQKKSKNEFTLILNSEESRKFVKQLIENTLTEMGYDVEIKEDISKLRVEIKER